MYQLSYREECSDKGGTNDGSCAQGYGVCCTCEYLVISMYLNTSNGLIAVVVKCGTTTTENNTYFESGGSETGSCQINICKASTNICQVI